MSFQQHYPQTGNSGLLIQLGTKSTFVLCSSILQWWCPLQRKPYVGSSSCSTPTLAQDSRVGRWPSLSLIMIILLTEISFDKPSWTSMIKYAIINFSGPKVNITKPQIIRSMKTWIVLYMINILVDQLPWLIQSIRNPWPYQCLPHLHLHICSYG